MCVEFPNRDAVICVIDDDLWVTKSLVALLQSEEFETETFSSGSAFLNWIEANGQSERQLCVLLDLHMPDLDGIAVLTRLAARIADFPVIIMTGRGIPDGRQKVMNLGARDYLEKPIAKNQLLSALRDALRDAPQAV